MSKVIDNRVVSMEFDNSQFEKNVQTSMKTLENLNKTLDNLPETAGKNMFDGISKAAKNIDLSGISEGIESLNRKFSAFGIAGQEVIRDLTRTAINFGKNVWNTTFGQIKSGGRARSQNIAQSKFTLEGMGFNFQDYYDDIDYAVAGTAYGFDQAAMAASVFASSGVKAGEDMKRALRGISGVAAMTGSSYEEIAYIFEKVNGNMKVTNQDLQMIGGRGLNATAALGKALGKTEQQITEMARKGQINFQMFAKAMDDAFGEHATDADRTLSGVTDNIRAQLSRIGQAFYDPLYENDSPLVKMLQSVKAKVKETKAITDPFAVRLAQEVLDLSKIGQRFVESLDPSRLKPAFDLLIKTLDDFHTSITPIMEAGKALFNSFKSIGKVGKEAFKEIFPGKIDITITKAATAFRDFIGNHLVPGEKTLAKFKRIFKGLFAFDSLKLKILKDLLGKIFGSTDKFNGFGTKILDTLAKIGDFFVDLNEKYDSMNIFDNLSESFDKFKESLAETSFGGIFGGIADEFNYLSDIIASSFSEAGGGLAGVISASFEVIIALIEQLADKFQELTGIDPGIFFDSLADTLYSAKEKLIEFVNAFSITEKIKILISSIKEAFVGLIEALKPLGKAIKSILTPFWNAIKDIGKAIADGLSNPSGFLNLAALIVMFEHFRRKIEFLVSDIKTFKKALSEGFSKIVSLKRLDITNVLDQARLGLVQFTNELKANTILKTAAAIAVLAVAMMLLASIDQNKLLGVSIAMGELFIAIGVMFQILSNVGGGLKDSTSQWVVIGSLGTAMIKIAAAVLILAAAMKMMDGLEHVADDVLVIIIFMLSFIAVAKAIEVLNVRSFNKVATSMILMAFAVKILASAMSYFDGMSWENVIQGLVSIVVIMGSLVGMSVLIDKFVGEGSFLKVAAGMLIMGAAIKMLASSLVSLASVDPLNLSFGLLSLMGIMGMLALVVIAIQNTIGPTFIKTAAGLLMIGASVGILAHALETLANIDPDKLPMAMFSLAYVLSVLIVTCILLNGKLLETGAGMLLVAVAMTILVNAIEGLGNLDLGVLLQGMLAMAACMTIMALGLKFIEGSIGGALAMLVVSVGLIALAAALAILTALPLGDLAGTLLVLCLALAALTVVCYAMTGAIVGAAAMLVLSVALIAFGAACAILTALPLGDLAGTLLTVLVAIVAFSAVATILSVLTPFILAFSVAMLAFGAAMVVVGAGVALFGLGMEMLAVSGQMGITVLTMLCSVLESNMKTLTKAATVMTALAAALVILDAAMVVAAISMGACALALGLLAGAMVLFSLAAVAFSAALKLITKSLKECIADLKTILDKKEFKSIAGNAIDGIKEAFKEGIERARQTAKELIGKVVETFQKLPEKIKEAGKNAIQGFINGIKSKLADAKQAAATIGNGIISKLKSTLKIKSPSRVTAEIGKYVDLGLAKGITDNSGAAESAAEDMANDTVDAMSSALGMVSNAMANGGELTITPHIDLSEIQNGVNSMDSMMDQQRVANIAANYDARQMYDQEQIAYNNAQMSALGNQLNDLATLLSNPTPVDVTTQVNLMGDADGVFKLMQQSNNRYTKMHGKSAFA